MLTQLTIKTRLIAVLALLTLQLLFVSLTGSYTLGKTNDTIKTIYDDRLVALGQLDAVIRSLNRVDSTVALAVAADPAQLGAAAQAVDADTAQADKVWKEYMATYLTPREQELAGQFSAARSAFTERALAPALKAMRAQDMQATAAVLHGPMQKFYLPVRDSMNALIQLQLEVAKSEYEASQAAYARTTLFNVIGGLVAVAFAVGMGSWLVRAITRPLAAAVQTATAVAAGDLTQRIEASSQDEMGHLMRALGEMNAKLIAIVSEVRTGTNAIASASHQIAAGNLDLSSRTEEQASSLEETASSMEELTSTVRQNADNARDANALALSTSDMAQRGGTTVTAMVTTMNDISAASDKIVDIIGVIDGIAFQTNILALNAAVEAARAGDQGRGFAVVAGEVRNLAQRCTTAAKEIKTLIDASVERVGSGVKLVEEAGSNIADVVGSTHRLSAIVTDIATACQEQASGIEQVNQAIVQMDDVTQQNASLVEEAAAASESLRGQADKLQSMVEFFRLPDAAAATTSMRTLPPVARATPTPRLSQRAPARRVANGEWEQF